MAVTQEVVALDGGAALVQTYAFTNPTAEPVPLQVGRILEHDDAFLSGHAVVTTPAPGVVPEARGDGDELVLRFESGSALVLSGELDGRRTPDRWALAADRWFPTSGRHDTEPIPAGGIPTDQHRVVAGPGTVTPAHEWTTEVAAGATATFRTTLRFAP